MQHWWRPEIESNSACLLTQASQFEDEICMLIEFIKNFVRKETSFAPRKQVNVLG